MSQAIQEQIFFQLATACAGMLLMCGYDLLRFLRWLIPHGCGWIWMEDLVYWSVMGLPVYALFYQRMDGVLRWYGLAGLLAGGILYEVGISLPVRNGLHHIFVKCHKNMPFRVAKLVKMMYSKVTGFFR